VREAAAAADRRIQKSSLSPPAISAPQGVEMVFWGLRSGGKRREIGDEGSSGQTFENADARSAFGVGR
jgi:hypothetical protein